MVGCLYTENECLQDRHLLGLLVSCQWIVHGMAHTQTIKQIFGSDCLTPLTIFLSLLWGCVYGFLFLWRFRAIVIFIKRYVTDWCCCHIFKKNAEFHLHASDVHDDVVYLINHKKKIFMTIYHTTTCLVLIWMMMRSKSTFTAFDGIIFSYTCTTKLQLNFSYS